MREIFRRIGSALIRVSAFLTKDYATALSYPGLLGVLILGPFLILLVFGVGYRDVYRTLRAIIVVPAESELQETVRAFSESPEFVIDVVDVTPNEAGALMALGNKVVDIVVLFPEDVAGAIESNRHAILTFYHQEIDPFEAAYVEIVARQIADETNEQLLLATVQQSQEVARTYQSEVQGIADEAGREDGSDGGSAQAEGVPGGPGMLWLMLAAAEGASNVDSTGDEADASGENAGSESPDNELAMFNEQVTRFIEMNPSVMVEPFRHETKTLNPGELQPAHFYVPAVLALLVQHIAVSLAGLSIVRERLGGTTELMRAAPLGPVEALIGKYLSFLLMLGLVAAALTALAVFVLQVPFSGSLGTFALVLFLLIVVSLGIGFLISGFVRTQSQAIQLSMVLLLATIFFSGLFIALYRLWWPAQVISWAMPATYGIRMLQDTMLRGIQPAGWLFWVLGGAGIFLFVLNWLRLRRLMLQQ